MDDLTLNFYNENAQNFSDSTVNVDFSSTQNKFLSYINPGDSILDLGCGSGRDSKYFLDKGYQVTPVDGSLELCRLATSYIGIPVKTMLFNQLESISCYAGVWACASILHCSKFELKDVFKRIIRSLKPSGIIYTSFKYGDFEGVRNGRYFTYFTVCSFKRFLLSFPELEILEIWRSPDVRNGREREIWLNVILKLK